MTPSELTPLLRISSTRGILVPCWVQPRAKKTAIAGIYGTCLKIALGAPPVDGKANQELCRFFAEKMGLSKSEVELVSGQTSRGKTILLKTGLNAAQTAEKLCEP